MTHTSNELRYAADIYDSDAETVLATAIPCGIDDLSGRRLEAAQGQAAATTHMLLFRADDGSTITSASYIDCEGVRYEVDYTSDPRKPRPRVWLEVYAHVNRGNQ